ncbi:ERF family protein [Mammaliicoccus lentus]|uniref:ERF family protein n=1 Tax=Mammaliicoccus lentus TaxID=42858 RepID=UPI001F219944|nr:ERF family protein [Mammaliicoccus sp. H-M33]
MVKNLYQRILDVKANIEGFTKDTEGYKYNYVEGSQILHKIRKKMEDNSLLLFPSVKQASYSEIQVLVNGKKKPNILVQMDMTYTFLNTDNPEEQLVIPFFAIGHQDDTSKAYGTSLTYAERYFLLKFFSIPTDEDDADAKQKREKHTKADKNDIELLDKKINKFVEESDEIVIKALKIAIDRNKVSWGYAKPVLKDWLQKGLRTIRDIDAYEQQQTTNFQNKFRPMVNNQSREKTPEWLLKQKQGNQEKQQGLSADFQERKRAMEAEIAAFDKQFRS